ncbi:CGNR zinc finger domain-containing protein [Kribbella kalugense]|uniref:Putative RNA-binding Zn ribbon-like protein n=1 Tax=Kribbella kalugense TaxID=2512221 RepID=A0A4R7ZJC6_9ACTN|nr:ABATE domain-containing protein [Kribbella kalugense]TDW17405.1 putative RNA-binding Zn ribbon-like protein [Kribbella kalugense]
METQFRQGAGRLCLDFVRTLRLRGTPEAAEELPDAEALAAWIADFGPVTPKDSTPGHAQVVQAQALREGIYDLLAAARSGDTVVQSARSRVNRAAAEPVPQPRLDSAGQLQWTADEPVTAVLALVARDALDLVTSPMLERVRDCANPDCGAIFLDASRPGTRRWCSMGTCGNQSKKAAFRTRHQ